MKGTKEAGEVNEGLFGVNSTMMNMDYNFKVSSLSLHSSDNCSNEDDSSENYDDFNDILVGMPSKKIYSATG